MPELPIGIYLSHVARTVSRAFAGALAEAGGSLPSWHVLLALKSGDPASQRDLAAAVGVSEATLTHHLNAMEAAGLLTRRRDPANRRARVVELTPDGEAAFARMRDAAAAFERRIGSSVGADELTALRAVLARLAAAACAS